MSVEEQTGSGRKSGGVLGSGSAAHPLLWYGLSIIGVLILSVARVIREPRFFFWDDTQLGAYGQWYGLGTRILSGDVTLLAPGAWQGGNYLAEGQWGIWNPLTWLIALSTHVVDDATLVATVVKVSFLLLLCTGAYLIAREYGAAPWWAALAGFTATAGGQTIYMDAPSWVTGLQNVALFALTWWALKRHVEGRAGPLLFFVFAYLLVTIGYVFGVIELAFLLMVFVVERSARRDRAGAFRALVLGAYAGLVAVFVYLPGVLTSPVTRRAGSDILNDQFLNLDLGDLATSSITTAVSSVRGYWGDLLPVPLQYVTWLLPLLVLIGAWRVSLRSLVVPLVMLGLSLALVLGPSVVGPLRYPARMMPYVVLCVAVLFAVAATLGWPKRVGAGRAWIVVVLVGVAAWFAWAAQPSSWPWVLGAAVMQSLLVLALAARGPARVLTSTAPRAALALLVASLLVLVPQIVRYPSSPLGNFNVPSSARAMSEVGAELQSGIMTVGDVYSLQRSPDSYQEALLANLWYLTGKDVASVYTVLPFTRFAEALCIDIRGWTCPEALDELFADTATPLADDMALNTVIVIKGEGLEDEPEVPPGWRLEERQFTWVLHRVDAVAAAGGVARVSGETAVTTLAADETSVVLRVDDVGDAGGDVVFSRLAWPGYTVSGGGRLGDPERGFLLTIEVTPSDIGSTVTLTFRPPGWGFELTAIALAGVVASLWSAIWAWSRRRERRDARDASSPSPTRVRLPQRG